MGRVEVEGVSLQAHATNEGITDTMLEGSIRLDSNEDGSLSCSNSGQSGRRRP